MTTHPAADAPPAAAAANRERLIAGFSAAIAAKGYAATTIADIVRHARVSKRTFYEHFADKDACFLAAYGAASDQTLVAIAAAVEAEQPWPLQLRAAMRAYLHVLDGNAPLTRSFLLEVHAAGPRALSLRREVHGRFAELLRGFVARARRKQPELTPLSAEMATALVGGINEIVLVALERERGGSLRGLENTAVDLVRAVLLA